MRHPTAIPEMRWGSAPELVGPRHVYRVRRLVRLLADSLPGGHVLDAGCGAGTATILLAQRGYRITAIDASPEFVAHTRHRAAEAGCDGLVEARVGNIEELRLPQGTFDGAVCGEVLEHLPDDLAGARAIASALRSGGTLAATVPAGKASYDWLDAWAGHQRRYDESDLQSLLGAAGLEVEILRRWGFPFMTLYERFIQRPGLARAGRPGGSGSAIARLARSGLSSTVLAALFRIDELFEGHTARGTGLLTLARKP